MLKLLISSLFIFNAVTCSFAKDISVEAKALETDLSSEMNADEALQLNAYRQAITRELVELNLDSALFWAKLDKKKMSPKEEFLFNKVFFSKESIARQKAADPNAPVPLNGTYMAQMDLDKLKASYEEIVNDLEETKLKTLYIIANIELDKSMSWEDVGVTKALSFTGVILDSWKKLFEKDIKGFEKIVVLEKDFASRPAFMNPKSLSLKWTSILKKTGSGPDGGPASYELNAQYILQATKSERVLASQDFPLQKRTLDPKNKKVLSSNLASLIYNLLFSQTARIQGLVEAEASALEFSEVEFKIAGKAGLLDINQINSFLQDKFQAQKLTSRMKSISTEGSSIIVRAEGSIETMLDSLSKEGGKFPLNEQKLLLFNRADKTFAILPKETNN